MHRALSPSGGVLFATCLALLVSWVSGNLHPRWQHRTETVSQQLALLDRQPLVFDGIPGDLPEFRNRVLVPLFIATGMKTGVGTAQEWFIASRLLTATLMFLVFLRLARAVPWDRAVIGAGLTAHVLVLSFNHPWEHPTDFLDVAFMFGFCALAVRRRGAVAALAVVAAANRESAAFAGVIWAAVHGVRSRRLVGREIARGAALSLLAYAFVTLLRWYYSTGGPARAQTLAILELPSWISGFAERPQPFAWPVLLTAMVAPLIVLWIHVKNELGPEAKSLLMAAVIVFGVSCIFGAVSEMRVFLPACAIAIYAMIAATGATSFGDP